MSTRGNLREFSDLEKADLGIFDGTMQILLQLKNFLRLKSKAKAWSIARTQVKKVLGFVFKLL